MILGKYTKTISTGALAFEVRLREMGLFRQQKTELQGRPTGKLFGRQSGFSHWDITRGSEQIESWNGKFGVHIRRNFVIKRIAQQESKLPRKGLCSLLALNYSIQTHLGKSLSNLFWPHLILVWAGCLTRHPLSFPHTWILWSSDTDLTTYTLTFCTGNNSRITHP